MRITTHSIMLGSVLIASAGVRAGDLNPPAGPVSPSFKTLDQVEPRTPISSLTTPGDADSVYRIAQPGSYYLTENVLGEFGKSGIEIDASNVTIDLMGFDLVGVFGSLDGIDGQDAPAGVTIRNGRVSNWGDEGIDLDNTANSVVESIVVSGAAGWGIVVAQNSIVRDCSASQCTIGINTEFDSIITGCASYGNISDGFLVGWGSHVSNCVARDNGGDGFEAGNGITIIGCSSMGNTGSGFNVGEGSHVSQCSSYQDVVYGVRAGEGTTVENCTIRFARPAGIFLLDYAVARNNTVTQTINDGIVAASNCTVSGNSVLEAGVSSNFGHGIRVTGSDNRVEGNQATDCDLGFKVEGTGNLIIRNTSSGNTSHWDIAASNRLAPIVVGGTNGAQVVGSSYAGGLGTTDPFANFTY